MGSPTIATSWRQSSVHSDQTGSGHAAHSADGVLDEGIQVERLAGYLSLAAVGAGQHEQVFDHRAQAGDLLIDAPDRLLILGGRAGAAQQYIQITAQNGQRGAQFMRRVGHELALLGKGPFKPIKHLIERAGQTADLIITRCHAQPFVQVTGLDLLGDVGDALQRPQGMTSQQAATERGHGEQGWSGQGPAGVANG